MELITRGTSRSSLLSQPTLYVFNAASIIKPKAIQQLTDELIGYDIDMTVISESHLKKEARQQLCRDWRLLAVST